MSHSRSIIEEVIHNKDTLPKKQKQLCDYILKNYQSIGLITVKELANHAEVGISTVMRTINAFGYDNFNDFRKDIFDESFPVDSKWTLQKSFSEKTEDENTSSIVGVWEGSMDILEKSLDTELISHFETAIDAICDSSQLNILGTRPYKPMALYLEHLLGEFYSKVSQLSHDTEVMFDKVLQCKQDEVLLIFAFEPYTNRIIQAAKLASRQGIKIILITDHISCPIVSVSSVTLKVKVSENQYSVVPIVVLIEALAIEMGKRFSDESINSLKKLEKTLQENNVTYSY